MISQAIKSLPAAQQWSKKWRIYGFIHRIGRTGRAYFKRVKGRAI
jgi:hypothetical protein